MAGAGARENTRAETNVSFGGEPACAAAVLEGCGHSNTRRKAVLSGRASINTLALRTVAHTVQVRRVPAHRCLQASCTGGRAPQSLARCSVARGVPPNGSERVCKTPEVRIFTRTLRRWGHACVLRSLQLMTPGKSVTHNPAPRCLHGIVPIDASEKKNGALVIRVHMSALLFYLLVYYSDPCVCVSKHVCAFASSSIFVHISRHFHMYCLCYVLYLQTCFCLNSDFCVTCRHLCYGVY